ncbi:cytochrome c [Oscillochloris sp. ZM17-4]|uniref:c-type cytochrome n=1 Tax=Oscillochloris sp. ZM17-4 TaxID=2866714 RepID=UPI001C7390C3|nr:cytochrome c [Oscillochloris sp. ZM17-4]MBX0327404.1 cytochrome c [Oscillochloris sp. ZM17-4]
MARAAHNRTISRIARLAWLPLLLILSACHIDMYDQAKYKPNQPSDFFQDGRAMRPPVPNTVSMGTFNPDSALLTGKLDGQLVTELPAEITLDANLLARGRAVFNSYCAPCHGLLGDGKGVIAARGPLVVPSYHNDRLRTVPVGYFFDVATNGINRMYGYGGRISPEDRWAVVAYIRALQLSQSTDVTSLSPEEQAQVEAGE